MEISRWARPALAIFLVTIISGAHAGAEKDEAIKYDFSEPEKVFKATMAESIVEADLDMSALHGLLTTGQMVIVNDEPVNPDIPWLTTEAILVNAPPDLVFDMIMDVKEYPEFVPQTEKAWATKITDEVDRVHYNLAIQVLFLTVDIPYSVYHYNQPPRRIDWTLASGDFDVNIGAYEVAPVPGDELKSMLFYTSYALPRNDTVKRLFNRIPNLDMMINLSSGTLLLRAMKGRAEELYKEKGGNAGSAPVKHSYLEMAEKHKDTLAQLSRRGSVVMIEDSAPQYYTGSVVIGKQQSEVYGLVSDFESWSEISKHYEMKFLEKTDKTARVQSETVIPLVIDFESEYILNYKFDPPEEIEWEVEPGGDLEGVAGSWRFMELTSDETLTFYRNKSDLRSHGFTMRQLLKLEPTFEQAIQASQTVMVTKNTEEYCEATPEQSEATPEQRKKMREEPR